MVKLENFTQNHEIPNKKTKGLGSPTELPICGEVKF